MPLRRNSRNAFFRETGDLKRGKCSGRWRFDPELFYPLIWGVSTGMENAFHQNMMHSISDILPRGGVVEPSALPRPGEARPADASLHPFPGWANLSPREREVLHWVAEGKTDKEIGCICGISHRTVQRHVQIVLQKLRTGTRTAAAAIVWRARLAGWRAGH